MEGMTPQAVMTALLVAIGLFGVAWVQNSRSSEKSAKEQRERADASQRELDEERKARRILEDTLQQTRIELKDVQATQQRNVREREAQQVEIDALRTAQTEARMEAERKDKEHGDAVKAMAKELSELGAAVERLKHERDDAISRGNGLQDRVTKLDHEVLDLKKENVDLKQENADLRKQIADLKAEVNELRIPKPETPIES